MARKVQYRAKYEGESWREWQDSLFTEASFESDEICRLLLRATVKRVTIHRRSGAKHQYRLLDA